MKQASRVTEYLSELPAVLPAGQVIVHNRVKSARRLGRLGVHGFRAWLEPAGAPDREPCPCPWAPELGGHLRVIQLPADEIWSVRAPEARRPQSAA